MKWYTFREFLYTYRARGGPQTKEAGIELRVSRTMIVEADSIARMSRILRGAGPIW